MLSWFPGRSLAGLLVFTTEGRAPAPGWLHSSLHSLLDSGGPWLLLLCWELCCPGDLPTPPGSQRWLLQLPPGSALCFWADHRAGQKRTLSIPVYPHDSHKGIEGPSVQCPCGGLGSVRFRESPSLHPVMSCPHALACFPAHSRCTDCWSGSLLPLLSTWLKPRLLAPPAPVVRTKDSGAQVQGGPCPSHGVCHEPQ